MTKPQPINTEQQLRQRLLEVTGEPIDRLEYNGNDSTRVTDELMQLAQQYAVNLCKEVIGKNEAAITNTQSPSGTLPIDTRIVNRNLLRTEQRQHLAGFTGGAEIKEGK